MPNNEPHPFDTDAAYPDNGVQAVTFLPLRYRDGHMEVMTGQNEVYNFFRNDLEDIASIEMEQGSPTVTLKAGRPTATMRWPGEYRFPGGRQLDADDSPLDTSLRNLRETCPGLKVPSSKDVKATLFRKNEVRSVSKDGKGTEQMFHVYSFIAFVSDNPWLDVDVEIINKQLEERRKAYYDAVRKGTLSHTSKKGFNLKLHRVSWMRVSDLVLSVDPGTQNRFVNDWQEREFHKYGVLKREIPLAEEDLLQAILLAPTPKKLLETSLETVVRQIAATKNLSETQWRNELFSRGMDTVKLFKVNEVNLLSYNLNCLPRGVWAGVGHNHAVERMEHFIQVVRTKNYDVLAMQEVFASPFVFGCRQQYFIEQLRKIGYTHHVTGVQPGLRQLLQGKWTDGGIVILSKFPIVDHKAIVFKTKGASLDQGASKGCVYAKIKFGNRFLLVFNTHLQASHSGQDGSMYPNIRKNQLTELRRFIKIVSHHSPGDFNIDAIPNHHLTNAFGYSFDTAVKDSTEYLQMMAALSPGEPLTDLLKEKFHHKHPSTRPPRLQFPKSLEYILHHKYPQRLDYVLFSKGSLGELSASVDGTRIEKFEISEFMHQPEAREGDAGDSSGSVREEGLSGEAPGSPGGFFSRWMNANSCRRPEKLPYQSLSDHYGLGISLRCEHTLEWEQRHRPEMGNVVARAATQIPHGGAATLLTAARNLFLACFLVLLLNWLDRFLHWSDWEMAVGPVRLQTDPLQLFPLPRDVVVAVRILLVCALFLNILREVVFEWDWWKRRFDTAKHLHGTFTKSAVIATTTRLPSEYGDDVGKRRDSQRPRSLSMDSKAHAHTLSSPEDSSRVLRSPLYPEELIKSYRTNIRTLADIFVETAERFGYRECAGFRPQLNDGSRGAYEWLSFDHIFRRVERFGAGLRNLFEDSDRLQRQTRIGILSENRVEWLICDQACFAHSFVSVPLLATGPTFLRKLLQHSGVALVVCGRRWTEQVIECKSTCPNLRGIVQMDRLEYDEMEAAEQADIPLYEFWYVETKGQRSLAVTPQLPNAHDVATIVYKVQLNNEPHGVVLTHENLVASVSGLDLSLEGMSEEDVHFSYAPLGHITERIMLLYALRKGMAIGFSQGIYSKIFEDLGVLKPTFLVGSPGIFENMFLKLERTMQSWNFAYRWLFRTAYARKLGLLAKNRRDGTRQNTSLVWDYFVFRRIARIMGGNLRYIVMTDGVLDTQVHDFVQTCFCCPVVYGLTLPEAGGLVSLTSLPYSDPSCLGFPLPCVELFIKPIPEFERVARTATATSNWCGLGALVGDARLGELCIRGPSTFQGYSTSQAHSSKDVSGVDTDKRTGGGWFGTGKVCHFNKDGTLTMVGELNDIIEVQYGVGAVGGLPSAWSPRVHHLVNLGRLEAIYSQVELVHQIWLCTYRSGVFPEEEEHNGSDGEGLREARGDDDGDDGDDDSEVEIDGDDREDNVRRAASRSSSSKIHRTRGKSEPSPNLDEQRMRRIHQLPLVAVVAVDHEQMFRWSHYQQLDVYDIDVLCRMESAHAAVFRSLEQAAVARGLDPTASVRAVHLVPITFNADNGLSSVTFQLRRKSLRSHFRQQLKILSRMPITAVDIGRQASPPRRRWYNNDGVEGSTFGAKGGWWDGTTGYDIGNISSYASALMGKGPLKVHKSASSPAINKFGESFSNDGNGVYQDSKRRLKPEQKRENSPLSPRSESPALSRSPPRRPRRRRRSN